MTIQEVNVANAQSSTTVISINVLDANDNPPVFPAAAYSHSFPEGTYQFNNFNNNRPRDLLTVTATDADVSAQFSTITYSITAVSNNGSGLFTIEPSTGLIRADGTFTGPALYLITVQASDGERYAILGHPGFK